MPAAVARVPTASARRYMGQLCKHFEHKLPVTLGENAGSIAFGAGLCSVRAEEGALVLEVESADEAGLARLQDVVARHLVRFAFREALVVGWDGRSN